MTRHEQMICGLLEGGSMERLSDMRRAIAAYKKAELEAEIKRLDDGI